MEPDTKLATFACFNVVEDLALCVDFIAYLASFQEEIGVAVPEKPRS